ncbi:MAG: hypothetical protein PVF37_21345 [Desulfobacterales bacterium]|jgi:hypothetical protein
MESIHTSVASLIEIKIMCQDDRMEFMGIDLDILKKIRKASFREVVLSSVFRDSYFRETKVNAKHETPDVKVV